MIKTNDPNSEILNDGIHSANFIRSMNQHENNPYYFNESGKNIFLPPSILKHKNTDSINIILHKYGLSIKQEERDVDKLVFSEIADLLPNMELVRNYEEKKILQNNLKNPTKSETNDFLSKNKFKHGVVELPSGLQYKVLRSCPGKIPTSKDKVKINYTAMQVNGKIFDSSLSTGVSKTYSIPSAIEGLKEGLQLMPQGSKFVFYIPSALAYQSHTFQGSIPPNSTIIYEVELVDVLN